ncbi:MAG: fibrobacter succinogenes major paralogous domain-containing protein [Bacteroidales bacterium]|nr:fibrobacter succinogenes major paralogous domain-containing protein [Bacteroidales bacterium]
MKVLFYILLLIQLLIYITGCESFFSEPSKQLGVDYTGQIDTVFDIDANAYKTVGIGSQIWMAQNLRTTRLNDGTLLPQVKADSIWDFNPVPAYCWYKNDSIQNSKIYGSLYNYYTVKTGLLCPAGWHVPMDSEWRTLINLLGGEQKAGGKLKDYYTSYWSDPNVCIVNNYSFAALPGGRRSSYKGEFSNIKDRGFWWTSTSKNDFIAYSRSLYNFSTLISRYESSNGNGYSVRCIKDQ